MKLGVSDFLGFAALSQKHSLATCIRNLGHSVYLQYKNDILVFLKFSELCKNNSPNPLPSMEHIITHWIPSIVRMLRYDSSIMLHETDDWLAVAQLHDTPHPSTSVWGKGGII